MTSLPDINELNEAAFASFNNLISLLFEPAPPLAIELYAKRPFDDYTQLLNLAKQVISQLSKDDQITVVNAHPRLGEKNLSVMSAIEQGKIMNNSVDQQLALLNKAYEDRHGFKFITFVNGRSRQDILPEIKSRIDNDTGLELECGLNAMISIAFDRLKKISAKI
jgi:2-oxo-4-hydroxy-4-carboxy--5-ureidoimidazoline (OHCU) decarboxylase